jgi:hypothetical protein
VSAGDSAIRRRLPERAAAWLATGPLGHLYGTTADLTGYAATTARRHARRLLSRPGRDRLDAGSAAPVCVIGAGSSGIAACQVLHAR